MDAAMQEERQALGRIAALLVALAVLAERVAQKPGPLRCFVIWLLSRAEIAARGFVEEALWCCGAPALPPQQAEEGVAEAIRLAASLRLLAATLDRFIARTQWPVCDHELDRSAIAPCIFIAALRPGAMAVRRGAGPWAIAAPPGLQDRTLRPCPQSIASIAALLRVVICKSILTKSRRSYHAMPKGCWQGGVPPPMLHGTSS